MTGVVTNAGAGDSIWTIDGGATICGGGGVF
jgi:hypothetical protein